MRIPLSKLHRAFPELDAFSDEECERYVLQVQRSGRLSILVVMAGAAGIIVGWCLIGSILAAIAKPWFVPARGPVELLLDLAVPVSAVFAGGVGALMIRDRLLVRALRRRVNSARCPSCKQSLLGLPITEAEGKSAVRCPECGELYPLGLLGLKPEDIRPRMEPG